MEEACYTANMPELPEVETVVRLLLPDVEGRVVTGIVVHRDELRRSIGLARWEPHVLNQTILGTRRRAKWPALVFPSGCLWMHLGMTGQIQMFEGTREVGPHDHLDLVLDNGRTLRYFDPRRFGIVDWTAGQTSEPPSSTLGPEPLTQDFTAQAFHTALKKSSKAIKVVLMDGKAVVGVGNIYASEALFRAKIHPDAPAKAPTLAQATTLHKAVVDVLTQAVNNGGSTLRDYRKPDGTKGDAQSYHFVYDRAHQPCLVCKSTIKTATHAGRATYWCAKCQPWKAAYVLTE